MRTTSLRAVLIAAAAITIAAAAAAAAAQEGHPLSGTWYGEYTSGTQKVDLTVILTWDGRAVTGTVNPGPKATPITTVTMDITPGKPAAQGRDSTEGIPPVFTVRFDADVPAATGGTARATFEGTIENPVAGNRRLTGTWTRGGERGTFQLRRL